MSDAIERLLEVPLSRRSLFRGSAALGAAGMTAILPSALRAEAQIPTAQAPYYYRFKLGQATATIVSDGAMPLPDPAQYFMGRSPQDLNAQLDASFLSTQLMVLEQNILVINLGGKTVLFDTGLGSLALVGPTTGRLQDTLNSAGIDSAAVDAIVLSHAHADHTGGIVAADGTVNFPNAQYYINQADFDYWTGDNSISGPLSDFYVAQFSHAKHNLLPVRDRIIFFKDGEEFLPGITAVHAPGHTMGHTIFMIASGDAQMCYSADLSHHPVLLGETPRTNIVFDLDAASAVQSRLRLLGTLAENRTLALSYHFAWPGLGHWTKSGEGFRFYPAVMEMTTFG